MDYNYEFFVSYSHKDNEDGFVGKFANKLENSPDLKELFGVKPRVFFDKEAIHGMDDWKDRLRTEVMRSRFLIVLLSPSYFQSEFCAYEFNWWLEREMHRCVLNEGTAPIQLVDVPGFFDNGTVDIPQELQKRFPHWVSELRKRQSPADFDLRERTTAKIDNTLATLCHDSRDKVWRQVSASKSPHNYLYPAYNREFVGRHKDLSSLRDNLENHRHVALYGLGGVGKTELALMYGSAYAWDYQLGRVYINCENQTSLFGAILGSGIDLMADVKLEGTGEERFAAFFNILDQRRKKIIEENEKKETKENEEKERHAVWGTRLLLILDNVACLGSSEGQDADSPNTANLDTSESKNADRSKGADLEPSKQKDGDRNASNLDILERQDIDRLPEFVHVIVTTRENPSEYPHLYPTPVDALTDSDALELLRVLRPFANEAELKAAYNIIHEFGGHAFRVEKIGAYLHVNKWETYQGFLDKTQKRFKHLRETIDAKDFRRRHEAIRDEECLRPTLEKLLQDPKTLLDWAAFFGPDSVAVPWLGELAKISGDELRKGLQELEDYRLLIPFGTDSREETPLLFDVNLARLHRIAREIVVDQMTDDFRNSGLKKIAQKIDNLLSNNESYWFAGGVSWGLDSIADFCYDRYKETKKQEPSKNDRNLMDRFSILFRLFLQHLRSFDRAREVALALKELSQRLADAEPDDLQALHDLSASYGNLGILSNAEGDRKQAKEYYENALEGFKKIIERAPEDIQALRNLSYVYNNLGGVSNAEGDRKQAKEYCEKALDIWKKIVEQSQDDLQALRDLSVAYRNLVLCNYSICG